MSELYGLMAEFTGAEALLEAARRARAEGYLRAEGYSPIPVEGLAEALGFRRTRIPLAVLLGGIAGGVGTFAMQWYSAVYSYPLNIGGRPLMSWPSFIPATFEITLLGAALVAFLGMLFASGLPRLVHPMFNVPEFDLATRNRFFLCLRSDEHAFDAPSARRFLESLGPIAVMEVPR